MIVFCKRPSKLTITPWTWLSFLSLTCPRIVAPKPKLGIALGVGLAWSGNGRGPRSSSMEPERYTKRCSSCPAEKGSARESRQEGGLPPVLVEPVEEEPAVRGRTLVLLLPEYEAEGEMSCSYRESGCQLVVEDSEERWVDDVVTRCK